MKVLDDYREFQMSICVLLNVFCWSAEVGSLNDPNPFPKMRLFRWLP